MARNFGSTGASSLLRSAESGLNKTNTYNDAIAADNWDNSIKDDAAFKEYKAYLDKRVSTIQNADPSKALALTRTATSAQRTFNSAQISRATQQVQYGNMSNRDKYALMQNLKDKAVAAGDYSNAQSLDEQQSSLSITIQNEEKAASDASVAAGNRQAAAVKKGYTDQIAKNEVGIKKLDAAKLAGQITPAEYDHQMQQFYLGNEQTPGIIALTQTLAKNETDNGDPYGTYNSKLTALAGNANVQKYANGTMAARTGLDNSQAMVRGQDGNYKFVNRSQSEVTGSSTITGKDGKPVLGQDGLPISVPTYANPQGFAGKDGNLNGFQFVSNIYNKRDAQGNIVSDPKNGTVAPGTGPGVLKRVDSYDIKHDDPSGVGYFYTQGKDGKPIKKFIGYEVKTDANGKTYNQAIMGNKSTDISGAPGVKYDAGGVGKLDLGANTSAVTSPTPTSKGGVQYASHLGGITGATTWLAGKATDMLGNLFNRQAGAQAQQRIQDMANAKAANDAAVAKAQAQAKLLPVFRAPAYLAPAPAPKPISRTMPALNVAPLPGHPGYVNPIAKTQAVIANPKSTPFQAIEALRGGLQ